MNAKTSDNVEMTDQFAEKIHGFVDQMQGRVAGMEKVTGSGSTAEFGERATAKFEKQLNKIQSYVEKNPMMATMVAFGIGAAATRVMKRRGMAATEVDLAEEGLSDEPQDVEAIEAA